MTGIIPLPENTVRPEETLVHDQQTCTHLGSGENVYPLSDHCSRIDAQLIQLIGEGDIQAFSAFYDRHSPVLYSLATRILNDSPEAEDVLQQVFLQLWEKASCFNDALESPFSWSVRITRNMAIQRLSARGQEVQILQKCSKRAFSAAPAPEHNTLGKSEPVRCMQIYNALNALSHEQRQPIELAFFGGLTHVQIADIFQVPLDAIKDRIRGGILTLRASLAETDVGVIPEKDSDSQSERL